MDPHHIDADPVPDPAYHFDVDPDPDPDFDLTRMRIQDTKMMRIHNTACETYSSL